MFNIEQNLTLNWAGCTATVMLTSTTSTVTITVIFERELKMPLAGVQSKANCPNKGRGELVMLTSVQIWG